MKHEQPIQAQGNPAIHAARFDHVVVGSSPMMLMQARELALLGQSVCVVDREARLGGAWQTAKVGSASEVEIASHVIEVFPDIYEYLEEASGVRFIELDAQPVRITRSGRHMPYFNRALLAAAGARMALGYANASLARLTGSGADANDLINYRTKLRSFLKYQLSCLITAPPMKGPEYGFADYIVQLEARCREAGVTFHTLDVSLIEQEGDEWRLEGLDGQTLMAGEVHLTTSCGMRRASPTRLEATKQEWHERGAFVVDIERGDIVVSQTYAAFWKDPEVSRISRIDRRGAEDGTERFLIELRERSRLDAADIGGLLRSRLEAARILTPGAPYREVGPVVCLAKHHVDQLPPGQLAPGLEAYYSNGNLAAGMAYWLRHQKPGRPRDRGRQAGKARIDHSLQHSQS